MHHGSNRDSVTLLAPARSALGLGTRVKNQTQAPRMGTVVLSTGHRPGHLLFELVKQLDASV